MVLENRAPLVISRPFCITSSDCGYCGCKPKKHPRTKSEASENASNQDQKHPRKQPVSSPEHVQNDRISSTDWPAAARMPENPTHVTIGCKIEQMTCRDYDELMNMGFRRLGDFLYKGDMLRGCCRMYTIRTDLSQMKVTKEHRQVVNRFKRAIGEQGSPEKLTNPEKLANREKPNPTFSLSSLIEAEQISSHFHTRYEPAKFTEEKFALYKKYQTTVHKDKPEKVTRALFTNFLCKLSFLDAEINGSSGEWDALNSWTRRWQPSRAPPGDGKDKTDRPQPKSDPKADPKSKTKPTSKPTPIRLGPTHECYYLDGRLVAVSVLDFLPSGVSSVYLIWDPDYAHLSLGTLLAIREVQMCHELGLGHYYLGYYLDDCDKMRYKRKFGGEVLDVCNEVYAPLEAIQPMMKNDEFWVLAEKEDDDDDEENEENEENQENAANDGEEAGADTHDDVGEHEVVLDGHPGQRLDNLHNVMDKIYKNNATYGIAEKSKAILASVLGYTHTELPLVLPGAIPLLQLVTWVEEKAIDTELPVSVFNTFTGRMHECGIGELAPRERNHVFDFLRLFGLERTQTAIIIA